MMEDGCCHWDVTVLTDCVELIDLKDRGLLGTGFSFSEMALSMDDLLVFSRASYVVEDRTLS